MAPLTARTAAWRQAGRYIDVGAHQIFVREQAADGGRLTLLFLHGYPSSSYDWRYAFDRLAGHHVVALDFLGFGLSSKPRDQVYSLKIQADIVEAVARQLASERVTLIAHDMGSSVATELLARDLDADLSFQLTSAVLFNASLVRERASLLWGQKLLLSRFGALAARLSSEMVFRRQLAGIFSDSHPLSDQEAADQWSLLTQRDGHHLLDRLINYNHERVTPPFAERWRRALTEWPGRLELAWAERDPICTEAVLEAVLSLRPQASLTRLRGLGHYPQIEDPPAVYGVIQEHVSASRAGSA